MEREGNSSARKNILIISYDVIGPNMAGPGIRFYEFAKVLSEYFDVSLASPNKSSKKELDHKDFSLLSYDLSDYKTLQRHTDKADIIIMQGHLLYYFGYLKNFKGRIIIDLYNPFNLESLEMYRPESIEERVRIDKNNLNLLKLQLTIGDFFLCASEKQRDYWIGMMTAMGRINPYNYDSDPSFRDLIDVVPFGIPSEAPRHEKDVLRGVVPNIFPYDDIIIWGGGIWNWLDPITAIKAMWELTRQKKDTKLVFIGIKHPDPKLPQMSKCTEAINLSKELELYGKYVFFNEWTPYAERQNFLLEADIGLSIHHKRIETEFSYRTRVMDYIWAKLPVLTTKGDSISKLVKEENIGEVVKYESPHHLARVMESMLSNKNLREIYKKNLEKIAPAFSWVNTTKPLVEYCIKGDYAKDKKKAAEFINIQNQKMISLIKENTEGLTSSLFVTSNKARDSQYIKENELGKVLFLETGPQKGPKQGQDPASKLKENIAKRTNFDSIIVNNAYPDLSGRLFYDLVNILKVKLKSDGLFFFSVPEPKGLAAMLEGVMDGSKRCETIDMFTMEYILKNAEFEVLEKGQWERFEDPDIDKISTAVDEIYGKNELFELFAIKASSEGFKQLKLLSKFDILSSHELHDDSSLKGKLKRFTYFLTSLYFENIRKSFNETMKSINNNIRVQINREVNELNRKNRERLILIYFNIFKLLENEVKNLGQDISSIEEILKRLDAPQSASIRQKIDMICYDLENIDSVLGLQVSSKYFLARKT
jgi:glycosyltransferase involved in cell wall biosynthesis